MEIAERKKARKRTKEKMPVFNFSTVDETNREREREKLVGEEGRREGSFEEKTSAPCFRDPI